MAYGLRYTIPQILRDSKSLVVYIYEDSYVGSSYEYNATSIKIQPNSNTEDPIACVISTQLDISFIISTDSDYSNLPDLLNYNDTKYYVELKIDNVIKWRGYLFNDYVDVSFTTGIQTVNLNCIDGLSFLRYNFKDVDSESISSFGSTYSPLLDLALLIALTNFIFKFRIFSNFSEILYLGSLPLFIILKIIFLNPSILKK